MIGEIVFLICFGIAFLFLCFRPCLTCGNDTRPRPEVIEYRQSRQRIRRNASAQSSNTQTSSPDNSREELIKQSLFTREVVDSDASTRTLVGVITHPKQFEEFNKTNKDGEGNILTESWRNAITAVKSMGTRPTCAICLDHYEPGDTLAWGKHDTCNHVFHQDCIAGWLQNHDDCPLCRVDLLDKRHHKCDTHAAVDSVVAASAADRERRQVMGNMDTAPIPEDEEEDIERGTTEPTIGNDGASVDEADAMDTPTAEDEDSQHYFTTRNAAAEIGSSEEIETGTT
mmetsp:Transcript_31021/g.45171  ORF Transcript_31021/g.45171 Transcript_31021/m.45171 type:complete len:285 (-) Transcript_31021:338-1192(-)